jgi:type IV secretory pathway VirJ component
MFRKYLFILMVIFYCNAQAQSKYIIHPACSDTIISRSLVIYLTSDGGWRSFDKKLTDSLCARRIPLMGFNSYKYFCKRKTPQQTLDTILPYIDLNLKRYNCQKFILAGYSFGSEVVPFIYNLMSDEWKNRVDFIVLLSPSDNSDFKVHFFDMVGLTFRHWKYDVLSEIMKIEDTKVMVFWGEDEKKFLKEKFTKYNITVHSLKGGHKRTEVTPVIDTVRARITPRTIR